MTFIPYVVSKTDNNNSYQGTSTSFVGVLTSTTGYCSVVVNISSVEQGTFLYEISTDGTTWTSHSSDTVYPQITFTKSYPIVSPYYRISYNTILSSQMTITSTLSTYPVNQSSLSSISVFNNDVESSMDAFGKLRVSQPYTLLDIRFPGQSNGTSSFLQNSLQLSYNATGNYNITAHDSMLTMSITGSTSHVVTQTRKYCNYQPGKSLLFLASSVIFTGSTPSYTSRLGYYDDHNGLYFSYNLSTGMSLNILNSSLTTINQSNWNIDKMNGAGSSGLNLDFSKTQLYVIDMEWLGVGRVRFGFYAFGKIHYCHQILNINQLTAPYTNGINLPIRHEIYSNGTVDSTPASIQQICSTVISEGGYNPIGRPFSISTNSTSISVTSSETPVLALRGGGSNYSHQQILPTEVDMVASNANDLILYRVRHYRDGVPFNVSSWTDVGNDSVCQYTRGENISSFSANGSIVVDSSYFFGKGATSYNNLSDVFNSIFQITSNVNNVSDVVLITAQGVSGSSTVYASLNWQEAY